LSKQKAARSVRINVDEALHAICAHGKGRCWYCDARLPPAEQAIAAGWDVRRVDEHPVASIILVCPECVPKECSAKGRRRTAVTRSVALGA